MLTHLSCCVMSEQRKTIITITLLLKSFFELMMIRCTSCLVLLRISNFEPEPSSNRTFLTDKKDITHKSPIFLCLHTHTTTPLGRIYYTTLQADLNKRTMGLSRGDYLLYSFIWMMGFVRCREKKIFESRVRCVYSSTHFFGITSFNRD